MALTNTLISYKSSSPLVLVVLAILVGFWLVAISRWQIGGDAHLGAAVKATTKQQQQLSSSQRTITLFVEISTGNLGNQLRTLASAFYTKLLIESKLENDSASEMMALWRQTTLVALDSSNSSLWFQFGF